MRIKNRVGIIAFTLIVAALVIVPVALAGKFHFNTINIGLGNSLVLTGDLAGLGNEVAEVQFIATGSVTAMCQNPGGKQAPGRNPISVEVEQKIVYTTDSNGKVQVLVVAPDPTAPGFEPSPTPKDAGCPNGKWTVVDIIDGSTDWTAAQILVLDEAGVIQIDQSYACTTTFEGGQAVDVTCQEV